jgi:hypothetical protein
MSEQLGVMPIGHAIREALHFGAKFRLTGGEVEIAHQEQVPGPVQEVLRNNREYLFDLIDDGRDRESIDVLKKLGVGVCLVETRQAARDAIRHIIKDVSRHGGPIGFDIETTPKPEYRRERPWSNFNKTGEFSDRQPKDDDYKDPAGTDPHRADIALAQIFPGGDTAFVFRGRALDMLLRSHWLRRQWLVAHNLAFETKFMMGVGYSLPPGRKYLGRQDCSEQAAILCTGTGFGGERRALASAAACLLGVTVPKALQLSDWGAATLSFGQQCYASVDAIIVSGA